MILQVPHDSDQYWQSVVLRREVLRTPLGLDFTSAELAAESSSRHFVSVDPATDLVVACCMITETEDSILRLRQMAVIPERQGHGLGRELITRMEQVFGAMGSHRIELHARQTAVEFYRKLDYQCQGEEFVEVGLRHQKMFKSIGTDAGMP